MSGFGGGGGGMRGSMSTVGGIPRTYGLDKHFSRARGDGPPPSINRVSLRRISRYFRPYWKTWLVILACIALAAGLSVLPPLCVAIIIDRAIPESDRRLLAILAAAMVGFALSAGLIGVLQQSLTARTGQGIMFDLRNELYRHLQRMSLRFYTATRSGEIVSRINNDVAAVQGVATGTITSIAGNIATLGFTAAAMFTMSWRLTLVALAVVPAFYIPSRIVGRVRRRLSAQTQAEQASLLTFLNERLHVGGSLLTNIYGQREADADDFSGIASRVRDLHIRQAIVGRWLMMILGLFAAAGPALIFWYGGLQVMRAELTAGFLVAFAALLAQFYRPLMQLATVYVDVQASVAVFDRIFQYLDLSPDVQDKPQPRPLARVVGRIAFENVGFSYPPPPPLFAAVGNGPADGEDGPAGSATRAPQRFALREVSFEIAPGQRVALVGPSGSGKTTITYLVPRFYDPDTGRITLDGHDLRDLPQEQLRRHIGMVTQETFLFHATVRENLLYARGGATEAEMIAACEAANIHQFISGLSEGYNTLVGERGFRLSGGEKQRLSIARALLKNPSILILDEATSSLDATSEYLIQTALEKLLQGRTSLIIAHRLSTILSADKIVVMNRGMVEDVGRHEELLERGGLYAELFEQQFGQVLARSEAIV